MFAFRVHTRQTARIFLTWSNFAGLQVTSSAAAYMCDGVGSFPILGSLETIWALQCKHNLDLSALVHVARVQLKARRTSSSSCHASPQKNH